MAAKCEIFMNCSKKASAETSNTQETIDLKNKYGFQM